MAIIRTRVRVNTSGLTSFRNTLRRDLKLSRNGPVRQALKDWVDIYARWVADRYFRYAHGEGDWDDISDATKKRKGSDLILIETGAMLRNINPVFGKKDFVNKPFGVLIKVGTDDVHPSRKTSMTIRDLLLLHNRTRTIFPDTIPHEIIRKMKRRMDRGIKEALKLANAEYRKNRRR